MAMTRTTASVGPVTDRDDPGARNPELIRKALAALDAGDHETSDECLRQMYRSAEELLSVKHILGASWIKRKRLDTTLAEQKYVRDWLDRDI